MHVQIKGRLTYEARDIVAIEKERVARDQLLGLSGNPAHPAGPVDDPTRAPEGCYVKKSRTIDHAAIQSIRAAQLKTTHITVGLCKSVTFSYASCRIQT